MKRRKSTVLTSLIVTMAMVMSIGGYLFADETETEVIPEEPAVEDVDSAQNTEAGIAAEAAIPNEVNSIEDAQTEDETVLSEDGEQTEVSSDAAGTIEDEIPEQTEYTVTFDANGGAFEEGGSSGS